MLQNGDLPLNRGLISVLDDLGTAARGRACDPIGAGNDDDGPSLSNSPRSAITVREASDLMTVGCRQVWRLAAAGQIIAAKNGRDWRIDGQAAADFGRARMGKLDGPRSGRDITRTPVAGQAPAAAPGPSYQPPAPPIRSASVPDSPLAVARTASVSIAPSVAADGPCPPLDSTGDDDL
jgi:excisionase family DNA binding protein